MPEITGMGFLVGMVEIRDPKTPSGAAAEQVAVEGILALAFLL